MSPLVVAVGDERAEEESGDGWMKRMGGDRGLIEEGIGSGDNGEEDVEVKERGKRDEVKKRRDESLFLQDIMLSSMDDDAAAMKD